MNNGNRPPKYVLVLAVLPIPIVIIGLFLCAHFAFAAGFTACIVGLFAYYIIFGIVYAVVSLKKDKKSAEAMGDLTYEKYKQLYDACDSAVTGEEIKEAERNLQLALQREVDQSASKKLKAGTIVLIILTVLIVGFTFACYFFDREDLMFAGIGAFLGLVLIFVIVIACSSHVRKNPPKSANKSGEGTCLVCAPCIGISYLSGLRRRGGRVTPEYSSKTNYKVIIRLDDRKLFAYSHVRRYFGDKVQIAYSDKSDKCYIVD